MSQEADLFASRHVVIKNLKDKYNESTIGIGLASNGQVLELLTSSDGSTWTIIITDSNGQTRMRAAGNSWETVPYPQPEQPKEGI